jgi:cysteine desulfurase
MGVPRELALGAIRFSFGRESTREDVDRAIEVVPAVVAKVRKLAGALGRADGRTGGRAAGRKEKIAGPAVPPYRRTAGDSE